MSQQESVSTCIFKSEENISSKFAGTQSDCYVFIYTLYMSYDFFQNCPIGEHRVFSALQHYGFISCCNGIIDNLNHVFIRHSVSDGIGIFSVQTAIFARHYAIAAELYDRSDENYVAFFSFSDCISFLIYFLKVCTFQRIHDICPIHSHFLNDKTVK